MTDRIHASSEQSALRRERALAGELGREEQNRAQLPSVDSLDGPAEQSSSDEDVLVIVALRTNQHDIQRRLAVILHASAPEHPKADAQVVAQVEPTANDCDRLAAAFGYDVLAALGWHRTTEASI